MSSSKPDESSRALATALRFTRSRVRSTQEVTGYLARRGVPASIAQRAVAECRARGLLDDTTCARLVAEHWERKGYAWSTIRHKLSAKGLEDQVIGNLATRMGSASDDGARARQVVSSYLSRHPGEHTRQRTRLARVLASRGFPSDLTEQVLDETLGPTLLDAER